MSLNELWLFTDVKSFLTNYIDDTVPSKSRRPAVHGFNYSLFPAIPKNACDEIEPGLWLGNRAVAKNLDTLQNMKVTHLINACMGNKRNQIDTDANFYQYQAANITFHGIPAIDMPSFNILPYLRPAADFIEQALAQNGIVLVHCLQGISRSATVVIAYLMLKKNMDFMSAVKHTRQRREIFPNDGFLKLLISLGSEISTLKDPSVENPEKQLDTSQPHI